MEEERKVAIVKRKVVRRAFPLWADTPERMTKGERKTKAQAAREEGRGFFTFCWNAKGFEDFADRCKAEGKRPNEALWSLIQRDMGWTE